MESAACLLRDFFRCWGYLHLIFYLELTDINDKVQYE